MKPFQFTPLSVSRLEVIRVSMSVPRGQPNVYRLMESGYAREVEFYYSPEGELLAVHDPDDGPPDAPKFLDSSSIPESRDAG